ncbi:hypothetical protein EBH_0061890 [Eimeria brunetti]|uniref:Uncharacterized protein n=1 Tax=Eimeria brunetti TaxID=51314 RepID=U6L5W2_9EIME|nr:hypothetical protein EBH_0061890 [Eimeria brunetti]
MEVMQLARLPARAATEECSRGNKAAFVLLATEAARLLHLCPVGDRPDGSATVHQRALPYILADTARPCCVAQGVRFYIAVIAYRRCQLYIRSVGSVYSDLLPLPSMTNTPIEALCREAAICTGHIVSNMHDQAYTHRFHALSWVWHRFRTMYVLHSDGAVSLASAPATVEACRFA